MLFLRSVAFEFAVNIEDPRDIFLSLRWVSSRVSSTRPRIVASQYEFLIAVVFVAQLTQVHNAAFNVFLDVMRINA